MTDVVCITGCTASGKSRIAKEIAEIRPSIIINSDSIQVYECMKLLSSRPTKDDLYNIENRLYGHIKCGANYNVGKWLQDVENAIKYAHNKNKMPILVGGTGLYFSALFNGLSSIPPISERTKKKADLIKNTSPENFLNELKVSDYETYQNIDKKNLVRVQRAWEVLTETGYGLSYWQKNEKEPLVKVGNSKRYIISCDQFTLEANILARSEKMFEQGVDKEVKKILNSNYLMSPTHPAHKAIGFYEVSKYISGEKTLEQAIDLINLKTRQYAKKQRTWFRNQMSTWQDLKITKGFDLLKAVDHIVSDTYDLNSNIKN